MSCKVQASASLSKFHARRGDAQLKSTGEVSIRDATLWQFAAAAAIGIQFLVPAGHMPDALADGYQWRLDSDIAVTDGEWRFGIDGARATHAARITNPNVAPFAIDNFSDARRDLIGASGQWNRLLERIDVEAGLRFNRVDLSSGTLGASIPAMNAMLQMMRMNAGLLGSAFNVGITCHW